jgi:GNAT superfamily N-acetyltransferase
MSVAYSGMEIRLAEPDDAFAVAKVHIRSWQVAYRDLLPSHYLDQLCPEDRAHRYDFANTDAHAPQTILAVEGSRILGFATTSPSRHGDLEYQGELCALYVDPEFWGKQIGRVLVSAARARLVTSGFREALLWVLDGNARAERFYQNDGWVPDEAQRSDMVWGVTVDEVRYVRALLPQS